MPHAEQLVHGCVQCTVRDLFGESDIGNFTGSFTVSILAHGAGILRITPLT